MVSLACLAGLVARGAVCTLLYYKQYCAACREESRAFLQAAAYTDLWVKKLPALAPRDWADAGAGRFCAPFFACRAGQGEGRRHDLSLQGKKGERDGARIWL